MLINVTDQLREGRKADLQKHIEAVKAILKGNKKMEVGNSGNSDDEQEVEEDERAEESPWIDCEEEYIDEDKFTTVTVEAVDVNRDGLKRVHDDTEENLKGQDDSAHRVRDDVAKRTSSWKQAAPEGPKPITSKARKKNFKYESKADRKVTRFKERGKGKRQAKERRGK